jgi:hypothetical protein
MVSGSLYNMGEKKEDSIRSGKVRLESVDFSKWRVSARLEVWGRNLLLPASGRVRERVQRQGLLSLRESGFLWKER